MDGDHPITRREDDRLGFSPIAEHLARAIVDQQAPQGFVFGIEGKWGSGKTTLINLTIDALKAYGAKTPEIVSFSPWLVGDRDELLQTLFDELAIAAVKIDPVVDDNVGGAQDTALGKLHEKENMKKALGPKLRAFGAVAGTLGKIARTADALGVPVAGVAGSILERGGEAAQALLAKEPASKRKAELVDALKLLARRIVVFVDDLDRLEPREASEVLRLIRAVANFPNIVYVLSYDPEVVAQTLSKAIQVDDGAAFLEKIIQVSFRVPRPEAFDLRRWFKSEVRNLFHPHLEGQFTNPSIESRLAGTVDSEGGHYLKTGRDVVRVLNALRLHAIPVLSNIDIADMVWLQLVKIGNAELYSWVEQYLTELAAVSGGRGVAISHSEQSKLVEQLDQILANENKSLDTGFIELGTILPGLEHEHHGGELSRQLFCNIDSNSLAPFVSAKRLGSPQHYRYYFAFAQPAGALTDQQIEAFVNSAMSSPDDAGSMLLNLSNQARPQGGTLADVLIDRLIASRDQPRTEAIPGIIQAFAQTMDTESLAAPGDFAERFAWRAATRLLKTILRKTTTNVRKASLRTLFEQGRALGWLTSVIHGEIFAHGVYGHQAKPEGDWLLSADEFRDALSVMLGRYQKMPPAELMRVPDFLSLLYTWRQGGNPDEVRNWVEKQTTSDEGLLAFLSNVRSWMDVNGVQFYPLRRRNLENFLDFDRAKQRLQIIASGNQRTPAQHAVALELLAAIGQGERELPNEE